MNTDEIVADYYNNFPECPQDLIGYTLDQEDVDEFNRGRKRGEQWLRNTIDTLLASEAQKREEAEQRRYVDGMITATQWLIDNGHLKAGKELNEMMLTAKQQEIQEAMYQTVKKIIIDNK